jgi:hypothetical protein
MNLKGNGMTTDTEAKSRRIAARLTFPNMRNAYAAADKLEDAGYDVTISQDMMWIGSSAAFAEAYKNTEGADLRACLRAVMREVEAIIEPFGGMGIRTDQIDPTTYVPFAYKDEYEEDIY